MDWFPTRERLSAIMNSRPGSTRRWSWGPSQTWRRPSVGSFGSTSPSHVRLTWFGRTSRDIWTSSSTLLFPNTKIVETFLFCLGQELCCCWIKKWNDSDYIFSNYFIYLIPATPKLNGYMQYFPVCTAESCHYNAITVVFANFSYL